MVRSATETRRLPQPGIPLSYNQDISPTVQVDLEQGLLVVEIAFALTITQEVDEEEVDVAEISSTLASLYEVTLRAEDSPVSEDESVAFGHTTGVLGLYPYWRELVYSVTGRMALPSLTLGVFQVEFSPDHEAARASR